MANLFCILKRIRNIEKTLLNRIEINQEEILADYPKLKREDIQTAFIYAATVLSTEDIFPLEAVAL